MKKFRVWSQEKKGWLNSIVVGDDGIPILFYTTVHDDGKVENKFFSIDALKPVIQYSTGLKDKNGVEIFEGDLIRLLHPGNNGLDEPYALRSTTSEVKWRDAIPVGDCDWSGWHASCIRPTDWQHCEIVGNVFEN